MDPGLAITRDDLLISRANTRELVASAALAERDYPTLMLCDKLYRLRFNPEQGLLSRSETLKVAVGFSPRIGSVKWIRRGATIEHTPGFSGFQASLRVATGPARFRGLKP